MPLRGGPRSTRGGERTKTTSGSHSSRQINTRGLTTCAASRSVPAVFHGRGYADHYRVTWSGRCPKNKITALPDERGSAPEPLLHRRLPFEATMSGGWPSRLKDQCAPARCADGPAGAGFGGDDHPGASALANSGRRHGRMGTFCLRVVPDVPRATAPPGDERERSCQLPPRLASRPGRAAKSRQAIALLLAGSHAQILSNRSSGCCFQIRHRGAQKSAELLHSAGGPACKWDRRARAGRGAPEMGNRFQCMVNVATAQSVSTRPSSADRALLPPVRGPPCQKPL